MNDRFDELTKGLAQSVTRRQALKKFGAGIAGMALACFGLTNKAQARGRRGFCQIYNPGFFTNPVWTGMCMDVHRCISYASADCPANGTLVDTSQGSLKGACGIRYRYDPDVTCSLPL